MYQFINGRTEQGTSTHTHDVVNPATGGVVATVDLASAADVDRAVAAARAAFATWARTTPGERSAILHRFASILDERAEEFARVESRQTGKPIRLARGSTCRARSTTRRSSQAPRATSKGRHGEYSAGPHLNHPARAHRRRRLNRALELPAADGGLEDSSGHRCGQHDRPQAGRDHAPDVGDVRPGAARRRACRPASSTSSPGTGP